MNSFECITCKSPFQSKKSCKSRSPKYCSMACYAKSLLKLRPCPNCGKQFPSDPQTKFCSIECFHAGRTSKKGTKLSDKWKLALSEGRKNSDKCKGPNLYNWKGGSDTLSDRMRVHANNRRSMQKIKLDKDFLGKLLHAQGNACFYCDSVLDSYKAIEHLTPLSRDGDNQIYNLVYSCKSCNSRKRGKTLEEFAIQNNQYHLLDKFDLIFSSAL